jgi:stage II sporulation protein D
MRRLLPALVAVLALVFVTGAPAKSLFVITGRGWGHGVGMSQWGAYGLALGNWTHEQILAHYYRGTNIDTRSPGTRVNVLLADGRATLSVGSASAFTVSDGSKTRKHPAGYPVAVTKTSTGRVKVEGIAGSFESPATISSSSPLRLGSTRYRGVLRVSVVGGLLRAVNRVGIDNYVRGVVTREALNYWGDVGAQEAIDAQAVAARSYALYTRAHGGGKCAGYLCPDTRDQVYGGYDSETPNGNEAVAATSGQVVEYGGAVAQTFFHSSSGGRTAASVDVWGGSVAYLQSEDDPADLNGDNPNRLWRLRLTAAQMRARLGLAKTPNDGTVKRDGSDRVGSITLRGPGWATVVPGGDSLRWRLDVKSNRFWLGVLTLERRESRIVYGRTTTLDALVRGVASTMLQSRPYGASAWSDVTSVNGDVDVTLRPRKTTSYRLRAPTATGSAVKISVRAKIAFDVTQPDSGRLTGIVRPKRLDGKTVTIQKQQANGSWATVATTTVTAEGTFRANFNVTPGNYRAQISPPSGSGLLPGTSQTLTVS